MIRIILGLKKQDHINLRVVREKIRMMSVVVHHTLLEGFNILRNSASEKIHLKWRDTSEKKYSLRNATSKFQTGQSQIVLVLLTRMLNYSIFYQ